MIEKVIAFLDSLDSAELDRLPPAHRQKFAALCHHWWQLAEHCREQSTADVLANQKQGTRSG
jgi:hypothetical protein